MQNPSRGTLNELFRQQRLKQGWSQQYIADQLGIAVGTVNRWERGRQQPSPYYIQRLTALFDKSPEELGLKKEKTASKMGEQSEYFSSEQEVFWREDHHQSPDLIFKEPHPSTNAPSLFVSRPSHPSPSFSLTSLFTRRSFISVLLALLVIGGGVLFFSLRHSPTSSPATASPSAHPQSFPSPLPSDLASLKQKPVFNDPMTHQRDDTGWVTSQMCRFDREIGLYHMTSVGTNYCLEKEQTFHNLVFQLDVSIQKGPKAGLVFRADANSNLYYFSFDVTQHYEVDAILPSTTKVALQGHSAAIIPGLSHWNTLTVMASERHLSFWINNTLLGQADDNSYTAGNIGVCVGDYNDPAQSTLTDALFRNARVWQV